MPLLVREWRPDFNLHNDLLQTFPLWVKLPNLPLYLWGENSLNKIGSALGDPIVTDECTANRLCISYARILVEIDITKELPTEITIRNTHGEKMQQAVEYEWRPIFCGRCQKYGHNCDKLKAKVKIWKPKPNDQTENKITAKPAKTNSQVDVIQEETTVNVSEKVSTDVDKWIEVNKSGKDRGKRILVEEPDPTLLSANGFDALGMLNDLLVLQNPVND
ncbi:uncharacterized protein LOC131639814 [Vicia villosa]|uniref:uncharacterized protein LOC131639814 n=1 Tax=Vicia villosa TaxID=3911 RepID=UPI00273B91C5|nr:uncharacterized protein LOC131639814 [Vicia villosa]